MTTKWRIVYTTRTQSTVLLQQLTETQIMCLRDGQRERGTDRQSDGERQTDRWTERDRQWGDNRVSCWKKEGFPPSYWAACVLFWKLVPWRMLRQPTGDTHTHSLTHSLTMQPRRRVRKHEVRHLSPKSVRLCACVCVFSQRWCTVILVNKALCHCELSSS